MSLLYQSKINQLTSLVKKIAYHIDSHTYPDKEKGLYVGSSGQLLFLNYADSFKYHQIQQPLVYSTLRELEHSIGDFEQKLSFGEGFYGLAWFIEFLNQSDTHSYDESLLAHVDGLTHNLLVNSWEGDLELIYGLSGISTYVAKRGMKIDQTELIDLLANIYSKKAEFLSENQCSWPLGVEEDGYNLGLAHGITGVITSLIALSQCIGAPSSIKPLILSGCNFLLSQQRSIESESLFPYYTSSIGKSRLGWCYGDLVIALTLLRVGTLFGVTTYIERAKIIAKHAAKRGSEDALINESSFCHGAIGVAVVFYLINKITPDLVFENAMTYWLDFILKQVRDGDLECLTHNEHQFDKTGLLVGLSGIGLGIITILEDETSWLDCFNLTYENG